MLSWSQMKNFFDGFNLAYRAIVSSQLAINTSPSYSKHSIAVCGRLCNSAISSLFCDIFIFLGLCTFHEPASFGQLAGFLQSNRPRLVGDQLCADPSSVTVVKDSGIEPEWRLFCWSCSQVPFLTSLFYTYRVGVCHSANPSFFKYPRTRASGAYINLYNL